jgi:protein ImuB
LPIFDLALFMAFASIYVPEFSIQAVVRAEPALRQRAIALIEGCPPLERVVARNEAAARMGLDLGMTKSQAAQFPSLEIRPRSRIEEQSTHAALLDLGWSVSPRVEDTAADSIVVDLAGLACLFGSEEAIAHLLAKHASDLGLIVQIAVSGNLEVALHAARGFAGITVIPQGEESERLAPLPIQVFWPPAEILETLERWGVRTCEALAQLPLLQLSERLGQQGVQLHQWSRGASARSMILAEPTLSFEEEMALEDAVEELEPLAFLLGRLLDQLCARLTARSLGACALRLRFGLDASSDGESLPSPNRNARLDEKKSYEKILTLPVPMRDSKMLLKLLRLHLQSDPPSAPIVHIFLAADPAPPRVTQEGLFLPSAPDPEKLELTIARLANVVGNSHVGSPSLIDSYRPDAFDMSRFFSPHDAPRIHQKIIRQNIIGVGSREPVAAFRVFRPAPRAKVTLREGRPVHISFPTMHGEVAAASGPWRTSGEWWREDAWHREEWDVEIRRPSISSANAIENSPSTEPQKGLYRIYYDLMRQAWFVAGMYD